MEKWIKWEFSLYFCRDCSVCLLCIYPVNGGGEVSVIHCTKKKNMFGGSGMFVARVWCWSTTGDEKKVDGAQFWPRMERQYPLPTSNWEEHFFCSISWQLIFHAIRSYNSFSGLWSVSITANYALFIGFLWGKNYLWLPFDWVAVGINDAGNFKKLTWKDGRILT